MKLTNSRFKNNSAEGGTGYENGQGKGGAIFVQEGATAFAEGSLIFGTAANSTQNSATDAEIDNPTDNKDVYGIIKPIVSINVSGSPAEEGEKAATFTISRATSSEPHTLTFVVEGNATFEEDYEVKTDKTVTYTFSQNMGTVEIPANTNEETKIVFTITPVDDEIDDPNENIQLTLNKGTGYEVSEAA
ncbi:hypothetical protein BGS_0300 [Beggiatoa sp. SS]|nr:hypothetical protein BGS_0300 [Beggiatoa sp. SS]